MSHKMNVYTFTVLESNDDGTDPKIYECDQASESSQLEKTEVSLQRYYDKHAPRYTRVIDCRQNEEKTKKMFG